MSKGGHSHKEGPFKTCFDFDGQIVDTFGFQELENIIEPDDETESGVAYGFIIKTNGFNKNRKYIYKTEGRRDEMRNKLKVKLISLGIGVL